MRGDNELQNVHAIARAQTPAPGSIALDHISHFVPDIDAASAALERLGFTLTPFSEQSHRLDPDGPLVPAGTGNRCIMLERGYLEFLTPTADTLHAQHVRAAVERYVGVHVIAFGTANPNADHARLMREGFEPSAPVALQRPIETERGEDLARFTIVRVPPGTMAEGRIQFCQHQTPGLLWQRRWLEHGNALAALKSVYMCVENPQEAAQRYSRFLGLATGKTHGAWRIETGRGELTFVDSVTLEQRLGLAPPYLPWIAGYALESRDISATRSCLSATGCKFDVLPRDRLLVPLPPVLGGFLIVEARGSSVFSFE